MTRLDQESQEDLPVVINSLWLPGLLEENATLKGAGESGENWVGYLSS